VAPHRSPRFGTVRHGSACGPHAGAAADVPAPGTIPVCSDSRPPPVTRELRYRGYPEVAMTGATTRPPRLSLHSRMLYATFWLFGRTVGRFIPITHPKVLAMAEQFDARAGRRQRMPRGITVTPVELD